MVFFSALVLFGVSAMTVEAGLDPTGDCYKVLPGSQGCPPNGQGGGAGTQCDHHCVNSRGYENGICQERNDRMSCVCYNECGHAYVFGEPAYRLFDGGSFWAHSECRHILVRPIKTSDSVPDFTIYNTNKCQYGDCSHIKNHWFGTFPNIIELHLYGHVLTFTINNRRERWVDVDGVRQTLPYKWINPNNQQFISIQRGSSWYYRCKECGRIVMETDFGLKILLTAGVRNVQVAFPKTKEFLGNIEGALGLFDGVQENDMTLPNGKPFSDTSSSTNVDEGELFLWHWKADDRLECKKRPKFHKNQCTGKVKKLSEDICNNIFNDSSLAVQGKASEYLGVFDVCFQLPYRPYWIDYYLKRGYWWAERYARYVMSSWYQNMLKRYMYRWADTARKQCVVDVCAAQNPNDALENGACDSIEIFMRNCRYYKTGAELEGWRTSKFCPMNCNAPNTEYMECAGCEKTCSNPSAKDEDESCSSNCEPGCVCRNGFFLNEQTGQCVRKGKCPKKA